MLVNPLNKQSLDNGLIEFNRLSEGVDPFEVKKVSKNRSNRQNRALHLYFTHVSNCFNDNGLEFTYNSIKDTPFSMPYTPEIIKEYIWRPIQMHLFSIESTTKINTHQINHIIDVITKAMAEKGLQVDFPNEFDYYLKFYESKK